MYGDNLCVLPFLSCCAAGDEFSVVCSVVCVSVLLLMIFCFLASQIYMHVMYLYIIRIYIFI